MLAKNLLGAAKAVEPAYIEDVFSTYLYTGTGSTQTITNNIDLSGKGGLVWIKGRSGATGHRLTDTARGATNSLESNSTAAQATEATGLTAFGSTGFTIGADADYNTSSATYASWTFRKQPKFFDIVTYTGDGSASQTINHNLGSVPGCVIIKQTNGSSDWPVYHRGNPFAPSEGLALNLTASTSSTYRALNSTPTATTFTVGVGVNPVNVNGATYVAYLFAHDAGGFGLTGTDNVISCGSYTGNGSATGPVVTLGYEPQWVIVKATSRTENWFVFDAMRGLTAGTAADALLQLNNASAELQTNRIEPTATGFSITSSNPDVNGSGSTYIYIAIRRGPMKVPTLGTSVFSPIAYPGLLGGGTSTKTAGFPVDLIWARRRNFTVNFGIANSTTGVLPRLTGGLTASSTTVTTPIMATVSADAETTQNTGIFASNNTGFVVTGNTGGLAVDTGDGETYIAECFRRAPGFFDVVCYTGNGVAGRTVSHNLAAVPELIIGKTRNNAIKWTVYSASVGNTAALFLNLTDTPETGSFFWNNTSPTSTNFTLGDSAINNSGNTHVAYLFATCPGVSKVGSYTGTGTTQTINCGFAAGARFVLIKRTDSTGDWYVWDTARGIVPGNDPYLLLNSTAAEVTNTDYIDTYSAGFEISSTAPAAINANGGTFIFLAIA